MTAIVNSIFRADELGIAAKNSSKPEPLLTSWASGFCRVDSPHLACSHPPNAYLLSWYLGHLVPGNLFPHRKTFNGFNFIFSRFLDTFGVQNFSTDVIVIKPCGCFIFQFWRKRNLLFANWFAFTFNGLKVLVPIFDDQVLETLVNVS